MFLVCGNHLTVGLNILKQQCSYFLETAYFFETAISFTGTCSQQRTQPVKVEPMDSSREEKGIRKHV